MTEPRHFFKVPTLLLVVLALMYCAAFARIHLRVQTTLIGYDIGKLKDYEANLLKKRSLLTMELAKMTSKQNLEAIISQQSKHEKGLLVTKPRLAPKSQHKTTQLAPPSRGDKLPLQAGKALAAK